MEVFKLLYRYLPSPKVPSGRWAKAAAYGSGLMSITGKQYVNANAQHLREKWGQHSNVLKNVFLVKVNPNIQ